MIRHGASHRRSAASPARDFSGTQACLIPLCPLRARAQVSQRDVFRLFRLRTTLFTCLACRTRVRSPATFPAPTPRACYPLASVPHPFDVPSAYARRFFDASSSDFCDYEPYSLFFNGLSIEVAFARLLSCAHPASASLAARVLLLRARRLVAGAWPHAWCFVVLATTSVRSAMIAGIFWYVPSRASRPCTPARPRDRACRDHCDMSSLLPSYCPVTAQ